MNHLFTYNMMMPLNEKYNGFKTVAEAKEAIQNMKNIPEELKAAEVVGHAVHEMTK